MSKRPSVKILLPLFAVTTLLLINNACQNTEPTRETRPRSTNQLPYDEIHRPQFHFSPPANWMNDPNGMVYYEGEYHLFYQYYPDSTVWGPMHWGHAVSKDLVHWENLPIALYPDSLGLIFSGSAVVDWNNSSGLAPAGDVPLVAIFTYHSMEGEKAGKNDFQYQGIAYSLDKGRSWTKYEGNPVIPNPGLRDFRDPKVFWHEASDSWVMIFARGDQVRIYRSPNLKDWELASEFGADQANHDGVWECPDLFPLKVPGSKTEKWVMLLSINPGGANGGSGTMYFIGDFDGKTFRSDHSPETVLWLDYGRDNYAGVSWSDIPVKDGRRLFMGWMSNWDYATVVPTDTWRSAMTLPRKLELRQTQAGLRLVQLPVRESKKLRKDTQQIAAEAIDGSRQLAIDTRLAELELTFSYSANRPPERFGLRFANSLGEEYLIGYEPAKGQFFSDRTHSGETDFSDKFPKVHIAPRISQDTVVRLHIFLDLASAETFADEGEVVLTDIFFPNEDFGEIGLFSQGGSVRLIKGTLYPLGGIW